MKLLPTLLACTAALLLASCAKPLPQDKLSYAGDWRGPDVQLIISSGGQVNYARKKGSGSTKVDAPLQKFEGNDFYVGLGPVSTKFVVSKPPTQENGVWKMTVDGVELTKR